MRLRNLYLYILVLALTACAAPMQRTVIPDDPVEAAKLAQAYINEANITLTAAANVVAENKKNEIYTAAERDAYVAKLRVYAKRVDNAQLALDTGDFRKAFNEAELMKSLIIALHREIAAKARGR